MDHQISCGSHTNGVLTPDPFRGGTASYLTYDKKGRLIKDSIHHTDSFNNLTFTTVNNYSYNVAGNRTDHSFFDDKINIHRTNKIWMFFDRDYCVNNPFKADSYNSIGLPTKAGLSYKGGQGMSFMHNGLGDIIYKCK